MLQWNKGEDLSRLRRATGKSLKSATDALPRRLKVDGYQNRAAIAAADSLCQLSSPLRNVLGDAWLMKKVGGWSHKEEESVFKDQGPFPQRR